MNIEEIAKVCSAAHKAYCESLHEGECQPNWIDQKEWQKQSTLNGINYIIDNPEITPEMLHQNWCDEKVEDGWAYKSVVNILNKKHPAIISYKNLPDDQKIKNSLFIAIVKALI